MTESEHRMGGESSESQTASVGLIPIEGRLLATAFYSLILFWALYLLGTSSQWQWEDYTFTFMIGTPVVLLSLLKIITLNFEEPVNRLKGYLPAPDADDANDSISHLMTQQRSDRPKREQDIFAIFMLVWVIVTIVLMYSIGLFTAVTIAIVAHLSLSTKSAKVTMAATAILLSIVYLFFDSLLGFRGWDGVVTSSDVVHGLLDWLVPLLV